MSTTNIYIIAAIIVGLVSVIAVQSIERATTITNQTGIEIRNELLNSIKADQSAFACKSIPAAGSEYDAPEYAHLRAAYACD